jgi:hypothetical protein
VQQQKSQPASPPSSPASPPPSTPPLPSVNIRGSLSSLAENSDQHHRPGRGSLRPPPALPLEPRPESPSRPSISRQKSTLSNQQFCFRIFAFNRGVEWGGPANFSREGQIVLISRQKMVEMLTLPSAGKGHTTEAASKGLSGEDSPRRDPQVENPASPVPSPAEPAKGWRDRVGKSTVSIQEMLETIWAWGFLIRAQPGVSAARIA